MRTIKGPGIFLAQFMGDTEPFNSLPSICKWAKSIGFSAVQIPTWDSRCIDLQKAAESKTYADELKGTVERPDWSYLSYQPTCKGSWWLFTPLMTPCLMDLRLLLCMGMQRQGQIGRCNSLPMLPELPKTLV